MNPVTTTLGQILPYGPDYTGAGPSVNIPPTPTSTAPAPTTTAPAPTTTASTPTGSTPTGGGSSTPTGPTPTAAQIQNILDTLNADKSVAALNTSTNAESLLNGPQGVLNTISGLQSGQRGIDTENVQANLARTQGMQGVLDMINHGLQSGGINLAHSNASNSSAAEALARAYGILGRGSASQVGNQYAQAQYKAGQDQLNQNAQAESGIRNLQDQKTKSINDIVGNATQQINYLNSIAASQGITGQFDVNNEIQKIKDGAIAALSQYDAQIANAAPTPMAATDTAAKAQELATAGTAAAAPYNYNTVGPAQLQGTGPFASELPIFTTSAAKKTT